MDGPKKGLREVLADELLERKDRIPTSKLGRLGRTAWTALSTARMVRKGYSTPNDADRFTPEELISLVSSFGKLKGIAMKMAQMLSYIDVALPEELRTALSVLQTHAQPMDFEEVRNIIVADLADRGRELLDQMEATPVAAASIGQVHRAWLHGKTRVAVKVRYPQIEQAIRSDFGPAAFGTKLASLIYPGAKIDTMVEEARSRFLEECDYQHEADAQGRFVELFSAHADIMVPAVHPEYGSRRVLTTDWVEGVRFEDFLAKNPSQAERDRIGKALFGFYIGTLFRHGLYNCDPHPGNYLVLPDGRIAILDYGCTRVFQAGFVRLLAALTDAVHRDERAYLHRVFLDLGMVTEGQHYDFDTARSLVRGFYGPMLRDEFQRIEISQIKDMRAVFQTKRELLKLSLPGEFLFLFRIRFGLLSILARLGAQANWYQLERGCVSGDGISGYAPP